MYFVYVLYSRTFNKIYVGATSDLEQRILSHNRSGKRGWTIRYRPWHLVYKEEYPEKPVALKREKELKTAQGRNFLWNLIRAM